MYSTRTSSFFLLLLAAPALSSTQLSCKNVRVNDHSFDLTSLSGPHSVVTTRYESIPQTHINTTYTIDLCQPLKKSDKGKKTESCPNGTRVCAIQRLLSGETDTVSEVVAIAGALENIGGTQFNWEGTRLTKSKAEADAGKEGLRLVFEGGKHPLTGPVKERRPQKAIIELLCDHDKTGKEGEWEAEDKYEAGAKLRTRDDEENNKDGDGKDGDEDEGESGVEHQLKNPDAALLWESYHEEDGADVLRLTWHTKAACEKRDGDDKDKDKNKGGDGDEDDSGESPSTSWGFFTWFVIIVFLGIAAYLIFGSWLNYNRYGARGWDLLPHGDTIRDVPYLLKDWTRRVLNTVQGAGSRGGYSAV